jgi:hypothetical protein
MTYGAGGEGKTLLAQMLATSCAVRALWFGLPVLECNSHLHFCEDDFEEMHRRQEDINRAFGCAFDDLGAMRWLPGLGHDNALMAFADGRPRHTPLFNDALWIEIEQHTIAAMEAQAQREIDKAAKMALAAQEPIVSPPPPRTIEIVRVKRRTISNDQRLSYLKEPGR